MNIFFITLTSIFLYFNYILISIFLYFYILLIFLIVKKMNLKEIISN